MTNEQAMEAERKRREKYDEDLAFINSLPKEFELPPKVIDPPKRGYHSQVTCRRCGSGLTEAHWNYCPKCGQRIMHAGYAGTQGWNHADAEAVFDRIRKDEK